MRLKTSIPLKRFNNNYWLKIHNNHSFRVNHDNINCIIIGDSVVTGLKRYINVWKNLYENKLINLDFRTNRVENALWCDRDIAFPTEFKNVLISCGTNHIYRDPLIILFKD